MSKQDRQGVRTPADVERKYNLGQLASAQGSSVKVESALRQLSQSFESHVTDTNAEMEELNNKIEQLEVLRPEPIIYSSAQNAQITEAGIDTDTDGVSISVPPGIYIITASAVFQTGSTSGARNIQVRLLADGTAIARDRIYSGAANYAELSVTSIYTAAAETTLSVKKSSSTTENSAGSTKITAVKIA